MDIDIIDADTMDQQIESELLPNESETNECSVPFMNDDSIIKLLLLCNQSITSPFSDPSNKRGEIEKINSYLINVEWIHTVGDMRLLLEQEHEQLWVNLKLPVRLKIAIKDFLRTFSGNHGQECSQEASEIIITNGEENSSANAPVTDNSIFNFSPLPRGWSELWDHTSQTAYYLNNETGETSWYRPTYYETYASVPEADIPKSDTSSENDLLDNGYMTPYDGSTSDAHDEDVMERLPEKPLSWKYLPLNKEFSESNTDQLPQYCKAGTRVYLKGLVTCDETILANTLLASELPPEILPSANTYCLVNCSQEGNGSGESISLQKQVYLSPEGKSIVIMDKIAQGSQLALDNVSWTIDMEKKEIGGSGEWNNLPLSAFFDSRREEGVSQAPCQYRKTDDIVELRGIVICNTGNASPCEKWTAITPPLSEKLCPPFSYFGSMQYINLNTSDHTLQKARVCIYSATRQLQIYDNISDGSMLTLDGISWSTSKSKWVDLPLSSLFRAPADRTEQSPQYRVEPNNSMVRFRGIVYAEKDMNEASDGIFTNLEELPKNKRILPKNLLCYHVEGVYRDSKANDLIISPTAPFFKIVKRMQENESISLDSVSYLIQ